MLEFLQQVEAENGETPKALQSMPELNSWHAPYFKAFRLLRQLVRPGLTVSRISLSEIKSYLELYPQHDHELFINIILGIDEKYVEYALKSQSEEQESGR